MSRNFWVMLISVLLIGSNLEISLTKNTLSKSSYTIAIYGDSMVDTMGENLDYLRYALNKKYPQINFTVFNFGIGSQNVGMGVNRFNLPFTYKSRSYNPVTTIKPDILIIGTFGNNPYFPYDLQKYKVDLSQLLDMAQSASDNVYLLAEIKPLSKGFGKGLGGVNWPDDKSIEQSRQITEQIEAAIKIAKSKNIKVIDTYNKSKTILGLNNPKYISTHDGIHPSVTGHEFMAKMIVDTIKIR